MSRKAWKFIRNIEKMRHFLGDAFFKERRKLTAEWKSAWQNGLGLNQRNAGVKVLCLTTWLPFYIQGYETRNPSSSFSRFCDLYIIV